MPFLTFEEQLDLFESRGMKIKDKTRSLEKISNINYYKLKEFADSYKKIENGEIRYENISFEGILTRFYTDKNLRIYLLDAIEKVEISFKTRLSYTLGKHHGDVGYLKFNNWCNKKEYCIHYIRDQEKEFANKINQYIYKRATPSISDFLKKNSKEKLPIWMVVEVLTFGDLVKIYELMSNKLRKEIANVYDMEAETLEKYMKNLNLIRNLSAHNNKVIDFKLRTLPPLSEEWKNILVKPHDGIATTLVILNTIIKKINPKYGFGNIHKTLNKYINRKDVKAQELGFLNFQAIDFFYKNK